MCKQFHCSYFSHLSWGVHLLYNKCTLSGPGFKAVGLLLRPLPEQLEFERAAAEQPSRLGLLRLSLPHSASFLRLSPAVPADVVAGGRLHF